MTTFPDWFKENENMPPPKAPPKAPRPNTIKLESPPASAGHRIVLYGPGGVGKTTLADLAPGPVASFDLDDSFAVLQPEHTKRVAGIEDWDGLRMALKGNGWDDIKTLVIDSGTRAEEWAVGWTIKNVPHEKGSKIMRIEDYGYGKGYSHVYDTWLGLLDDLDRHARSGRNVIIICHDCTQSVPNPMGDDWIRWEPRLQAPASGKASIRLRTREWADHVFFLGYDVAVVTEKGSKGKGEGSGTRTLWPVEVPHAMAKSRTLADPIPIEAGDTTLWDTLFNKEG